MGWTRATSWARMAFRHLPAFGDFLAVRATKEFKLRTDFELWADEMQQSHTKRCCTRFRHRIPTMRIHCRTVAHVVRILHGQEFASNVMIAKPT